MYELGGDSAYTMAEFAAEVAGRAAPRWPTATCPVDEYRAALVEAGLPDEVATRWPTPMPGVARGELATDSGHLRALIGRPTTTLAQAVAAGLAR